MAKYSRLQVLTTMIETGLVPIFYHGEADTAVQIVEALLDGGVRCIEFTNRGDQAHLVFGELVRRFANDPRPIFGAGSVVDRRHGLPVPATRRQFYRWSNAEPGGCQCMQPAQGALLAGMWQRQ